MNSLDIGQAIEELRLLMEVEDWQGVEAVSHDLLRRVRNDRQRLEAMIWLAKLRSER